MVAKEKLDSLIARLQAFVSRLRTLGALPREKLLADVDKLGSAKYHFIVAIECCIDIANHVIASERYRIPRDNADSFVVLVENGVCPRELEQPLRAMARFRNRLVHLYWDVDDDRVATYLSESLDDFDRLASAIASAFSG